MKSSPFIGLVVDETVEALERRRLVLFSTAISLHTGQTFITFLGTILLPDSEDCTAADKTVKEMLSFGLPTNKIAWLNSVASSPLTHRLSGTQVKVKALCTLRTEIHCLLHPWSSPLQRAKDIFEAECVQKYEAAMDTICRLSVNFTAENGPLRELQNVFQFCEMDVERPKLVHWSNISPAVEVVDSSWTTLLFHLESKSERSASVKNSQNSSWLSLKSFWTLCLSS